MEANKAVDAGLLADGMSPQLLVLLFGAGVVSSVNPCSAAALPAVAASIAALARDGAGALAQGVAFAFGSGSVLALLGLSASVLGERAALLQQNGPLQLVFPGVAILMGLGLLGALPLRLPGATGPPKLPPGVPRELQGFLLGALSAAGSSPCATPVLVTVVSFLATNPQGVAGSAALLFAYALGYTAPVALISSFAGALPWLQQGSELGPLIGGMGLLAVGTELLVSRLGDGLGLESAFALSIAMAATTAALVAALGFFRPQQPAAAARPMEVSITPVDAEPGVYRYTPVAATGSTATADSTATVAIAGGGGLLDDGRRTALAAVCLGSAVSGASAKSQLDAAEASPEYFIRDAARRSPKLAEALRSGRPTVVDFSASWCVDCLKVAPSMHEFEQKYAGPLQFVTVDLSALSPAAPQEVWSDRANVETLAWSQQFGVDAIPHVAFVTGDGRVLTALVGNIPEDVVRANILALRDGKDELPFVMYDAFKGRRALELPPE